MNHHFYTIGEIHRLGLLKKHDGTPYADRTGVMRRLSRKSPKEIATPFGIAKYYSTDDIEMLNAEWPAA